jgi:DNA-binding FadR family transcriptional regulator
MEQTGLSRSAVREALRILETEGLVTTRLGRYGGSFVCQPSEEMFLRYLQIFSRSHNIPLQSLFEARLSMEPLIAVLAATNRTEADMAELAAGLKELEQAVDLKTFIDKNFRCHVLIAAASHNQLLKVLLSALYALIRDAAVRTKEFVDEGVRKEVVQFHRHMQAAISKQDTEAAQRRMTSHVKAYEKRAAIAGLSL